MTAGYPLVALRGRLMRRKYAKAVLVVHGDLKVDAVHGAHRGHIRVSEPCRGCAGVIALSCGKVSLRTVAGVVPPPPPFLATPMTGRETGRAGLWTPWSGSWPPGQQNVLPIVSSLVPTVGKILFKLSSLWDSQSNESGNDVDDSIP